MRSNKRQGQTRGPVNRLRTYREMIGLTQEQLGAETGLNGQTISFIELRVTNPRPPTRRKLAEYFSKALEKKVNVYDIFPPAEEERKDGSTFNPAA